VIQAWNFYTFDDFVFDIFVLEIAFDILIGYALF